MDDIVPLKHCPKCHNDFPPTLEYFNTDRSKKTGLTCYCKLCQSTKGGKKPSRKPKTDAKRHRSASQGYKWCSGCQQEKPATQEYFYSHKGRKDGLGAKCKDCLALYRKARVEELQAYHRQQGLKNLDRIRARKKAYRESHAEEIRRKSREHYYTHIEEKRAYVERNRERIRAYHRNYRDTNPEKVSEYSRVTSRNRRARKEAARGSFTVADVRSQYQRQKGKCYWCHEKLTEWHIDHIVPLARGGSNDPSNIVIACPFCNMSKGDKLPHEWRGSGGHLL